MEWEMGRHKIGYHWDTWGNAKNYDKLITNLIRAVGVFFVASIVQHQFLGTIGILIVGVTDVQYFQLEKKQFKINFW